MLRKYLFGFASFVLAFVILSVSLLRSSSVSYAFTSPTPTLPIIGAKVPEVDYQIPYPGGILPDSPLWVFKAARDRIWYKITTNPLKKAELALLFSDKRLLSSKILFESKKPDIALATLTKGEKYLETSVAMMNEAIAKGFDASEFTKKLAVASLKHREIIENFLPLVPEDGKPVVVKSEDYAKNAYKASRDALNSKGLPVPNNPFDGE